MAETPKVNEGCAIILMQFAISVGLNVKGFSLI